MSVPSDKSERKFSDAFREKLGAVALISLDNEQRQVVRILLLALDEAFTEMETKLVDAIRRIDTAHQRARDLEVLIEDGMMVDTRP